MIVSKRSFKLLKSGDNLSINLKNIKYSTFKLKAAIELAIMIDWPTSRPLIPAKMLIAFVQKTASMPM